ncbi:helix-turn-helix domain-containing protein [Methylococcaceae bacterium WWC4]|nr:helix-turn-helix domain-containing protein [Methylococcaceae bacterium WWC4]
MTNNAILYSSAELPENTRFDVWRETFAKEMAGFDMRHCDVRPFYTKASFRALGAVSLATNLSTAMLFDRNQQNIAHDGLDGFALPLCVNGKLEISQGKTRMSMHKDRAALVDFGRALNGGLAPTAPGEHQFQMSLCLPRGEFLHRVPKAECLTMQPFENKEALSLLINYLRMLDRQELEPSADLDRLVGEHVLDLAAFLCGSCSNDDTASGGVRAARKAALTNYIEKHFRQPGLSVADIATALKISKRYLYALLNENNESVTQILNRLRLECAARMLTSPIYRQLSITDIALHSGFNDVSYFYRQFRRRFGETPNDFRSRTQATPSKSIDKPR